MEVGVDNLNRVDIEMRVQPQSNGVNARAVDTLVLTVE